MLGLENYILGIMDRHIMSKISPRHLSTMLRSTIAFLQETRPLRTQRIVTLLHMYLWKLNESRFHEHYFFSHCLLGLRSFPETRLHHYGCWPLHVHEAGHAGEGRVHA